MKSFIQFILEVATTQHTVGRGNKSGIRRTVEKSKGRHISDVTTKYSFKHPDGKRHVHVRFEGRQYDNKPHREENLSWTIAHDEAGHGHVKKIVSSEPHHTGEILSKVHSITKHHLKNAPSHVKEVSWTSEKEHTEYGTPTSKPGIGAKTKIYQRQAKRNPHEDWHYSDNSHHVANDLHRAQVHHRLTRKEGNSNG